MGLGLFNQLSEKKSPVDGLDRLSAELLNYNLIVSTRGRVQEAVWSLELVLSEAPMEVNLRSVSRRKKHRDTYHIQGREAQALNLALACLLESASHDKNLLQAMRMSLADCEIPVSWAENTEFVAIKDLHLHVNDSAGIRALGQIYREGVSRGSFMFNVADRSKMPSPDDMQRYQHDQLWLVVKGGPWTAEASPN